MIINVVKYPSCMAVAIVINPLNSGSFWENTKIHLHFLSCLGTETTRRHMSLKSIFMEDADPLSYKVNALTADVLATQWRRPAMVSIHIVLWEF